MSYNSGSNRARNFKSASRFALGRFRNYSPDYSLNCTPLGPITVTNSDDNNCNHNFSNDNNGEDDDNEDINDNDNDDDENDDDSLTNQIDSMLPCVCSIIDHR